MEKQRDRQWRRKRVEMIYPVTQLCIMLVCPAVLIAIGGIAVTRAWPAAVHAQPTTRTITYRARYQGQPVVLRYSGHRTFHGADMLEGTLVALGHHYWVEADYFYKCQLPTSSIVSAFAPAEAMWLP